MTKLSQLEGRMLYTRYPIVARALGLASRVRRRVRRASKGIERA